MENFHEFVHSGVRVFFICCVLDYEKSLNLKIMKRNWISVLSVTLLAAIFTIGCEVTSNVQTADLITAEDDAIADLAYDDVFSQVDAVMNLMDQFGYEMSGLKSGLEGLDTCPVISIVTTPGAFWPRTVIVDYGDGCGLDNALSNVNRRIRKGKIIIKVTGPMWLQGSYREVTLENFFVNDHKVEGKRTVTNEGRWDDGSEYEGFRYFSVVLEGGKVTTPDGLEITKDLTRTRTFVEGEETRWDTRDDIWYIDGIATGTNRKGIAFTREITSPLWKEIGCRFITQGTVLISVEGRPDVILDYGDGTCDRIATVTVDGETKEIDLKRW